MKKYRWAILGAGHIAHKFTAGLLQLPNAVLAAVASRSMQKAADFAAQYGFEKAYGSYSQMLADPDIDVVYIATTNNLHCPHTLLCLDAGKAVLCEKPFASNSQQVRQMIEKAKEKQLFLMEALWTRFLPPVIAMRNALKDGLIGKPRLLQANFGFAAAFNPQSRLFNPELGGGSIPDIGIYPALLAVDLFGKPVAVQALASLASTGTDATTGAVMKHEGGEISMFGSSFQTNLHNRAVVYGDSGYLKLEAPFHAPTSLKIQTGNGAEYEIPVEQQGNGYNYQAAEVMRCLELGLTESPLNPLKFSVDLMNVLDQLTEKALKS